MSDIGHWPFLVSWLRSDKSEGPVLISGDDSGVLVNNLINLSKCLKKGDQPCESCDGCRSSVPTDIIEVSTDKASIGIEELRGIWEALRFTPFAVRRLVIIPGADRLTLPASNALLKALEESAPTTRFILTSDVPRKLIPTIISRCQTIRLEQTINKEQGRTSAILNDSPMNRLLNTESYTEADFDDLLEVLSLEAKKSGPSNELRIALTRLRDYYRIKQNRGNVKLSKEVLLASLPTIKTL